VFLRVLAVLAAIVIPLLLTIEAVSQLHPLMFWVGPIAAIACTLPIVHAAVGARGQALLGAALVAMAAAATPELPELLRITAADDVLPVHDLRDGPLPTDADGYVAVRGYLREEWVVDEYHPNAGERPDQNLEPTAVLLPLLGTTEIELRGETLGRVIVARVTPEQLGRPAITTLRGRLSPVGDEIVDSLFIVQVDERARAANQPAGREASPHAGRRPSTGGSGGREDNLGVVARPEAVMLDTFDMPTRAEALTRTGLAAGAALLGLLMLWFALPRRPAVHGPRSR
jgi:hypothetical protein